MSEIEFMETVNEMQKRGIVWVQDDKLMLTQQFRTRLLNIIVAVSKKKARKSTTVKDVNEGVVLAILETGPTYKKQICQMSGAILTILDTMAERIIKRGG